MRSVLRHIAAAKRADASEPFFEFLRNGSWAPRDRLRFVPCMAPFITDFGDLNRYVLRDLYSDRMAVGRLLAARLAHLVADATPLERLIVIEAIEETGNVLFELVASLAPHVERDEGIELRYLGDFHLVDELLAYARDELARPAEAAA